MVLTDEQRARLRFDEHGLIPAVVATHDTGEVLMLAWMSAASLDETLARGETVFYSRSRRRLWHKGETSGEVQPVHEIRLDCDGDALLVLVDVPADRVACHTGERSCFHRGMDGPTP